MNRETEGLVPAFTLSQWQELEHQALIYKYLLAGLPVPQDLVTPIQNNISSSSFFHRPSSLGYSYCGRESSLYGYGYGYGYAYGYGKKVDPEPGRCRRTDGKKWRCSKEAYPDSKYCERHMHRGRSRSRKPVESQSLSSSNTSSLTLSSSYVSASARTLDQTQSLQLNFNALGSASSNDNSDWSEFQLNSIPYAIPTKHYSRHLQGSKPEAEHISYAQCSGGNRSLLMDSDVDNKWPTMSSQMPLFSPSKSMDSSSLHYDYSRQTYVNCDSGPSQPVKQSSQPLQPFFEVWPNTREAWSGLEDDGANQLTFSTRQTSVSVPMAASDLSTSPQSPQE